MFYFLCFVITIICLIVLFGIGGKQRVSIVLFGMAMTIGNGGYYALSVSKNLEEAILANKLAYMIGIFIPLLLFLIMCEICSIDIKTSIITVMFSIQILLYLCVCTVGQHTMFYETVQYNVGQGGAYLTKTYGPAHTIYIISLFFYIALCVLTAIVSITKKNIVNVMNVEIILAVDVVATIMYLIERFINLDIELMPVIFTIGFIFNVIPIVKLHVYSVDENKEIMHSKLESSAYIVFDRKLKFRGCNDYARELYPELKEWELERKIPGNGGRFNTYLRQPLLNYVRDSKDDAALTGKFSMKDEFFEYSAQKMRTDSGRHIGYYLEINNISDYVNTDTSEKEGE